MLHTCVIRNWVQAKAKQSNGQGRWPVKSAEFLLGLLKNAESNAEVGGVGVQLIFYASQNPPEGQRSRNRVQQQWWMVWALRAGVTMHRN